MAHYQVNIEQFTGPLDLLLHLIRVNQMDIFDLDVARITDEYLQIIEDEGVKDLAGAYHFLAMAATLVELKSRMLLPKHDKEVGDEEGDGELDIDPREQLARQLAAYQSIQDVTTELEERYEQTGKHWPKQIVEKLEAEIVYSMESLSVYDLMQSFQEVLNRPRFKQITIFKEDYDIEEARGWLSERMKSGPAMLKDILYEQQDLISLIVTFIAVLDLIKDSKMTFDASEEAGVVISWSEEEADVI